MSCDLTSKFIDKKRRKKTDHISDANIYLINSHMPSFADEKEKKNRKEKKIQYRSVVASPEK